MNNNSKKYTILKQEFLSYLILISISILGGLENTDFELAHNHILVFAGVELVLFSILITMRRYKKKKLLSIVTIVLLSLLIYFKSTMPNFFFLMILAIVFSTIDYRKGIKTILICRTVMLVAINCLSIIGVLDLYEKTLYKITKTVIGYGLGYTHPNRLSFVILYLTLLFFCVKNNKIKRKDYIFMICFTIISFLVTGSRTALYCMILLFALLIIVRSKVASKTILFLFKAISLSVIPVCSFISIIIPMMFRQLGGSVGTFITELDYLMNHRIALASNAFQTFNVTLFGGNIYNEMELRELYGYATVDNGYVRFLFRFGYFGFSILILFGVITIYYLLEKKEYNYVIACIIVAVWGVSENILISYSFNMIAIFWSEIIRERQRKNSINSREVLCGGLKYEL